jgi:tetratricopeptide (TPR) repeat protein
VSSRAATKAATAPRVRVASGLSWGSAVPVGLAGVVFWLGYDGGSYNLPSWTKVGIVVWWAVALGVAIGVWPRARIGRAAAASVGLIAAFAAFAGLSAIWASSASGAVEAMARGFVYCGVLVLVLLACSRGLAARSSDGIALGLVAIGLLAALSRFFPSAFPPDRALQFIPDAHTRLSYPVTYWNGLAVLVALACPLLLRIAVCGRSPFVRAVAVAPFPLIAAIIYLASSRSGGLTAVVGSGAFVLLAGSRWRAAAAAATALAGSAVAIVFLARQHELVNGPIESSAAHSQGRLSAAVLTLIAAAVATAHWLIARRLDRVRIPRRAGRVALVVVAALVVAGIMAANPAARWNSFTTPPAQTSQNYISTHFLSSSGNWRWQLWQAAFDEWKTRPLTGRGAGSYEAWWAQHGTTVGFIGNAHSLFAETSAELGLIGLTLLLGAFVVGVVAGIRRALRERGPLGNSVAAAATAGFIAYVIASGVDWMWQLPAVSIVGFALLGLAVGPATRPKEAVRGAPGPRRALRVAIAVAALVALVVEADVFAADSRIADSQAAAARGDLSAARSAASDARALEPWSAVPYLQQALLAEAAGDLAGAQRSIQHAIARDESNWRLLLIDWRIEGKLGRRTAAMASYEKARNLNPRSPVFAAVTAPSATQPRPLVTAVHDPLNFPLSNAATQFMRSHAAGASIARILIDWQTVAPRAPAESSDPANPGNPAYRWASVDRQLKLASDAGLEPILDVYDPPYWARKPTSGSLDAPQLRDPAGDFGKFMLAAARRYSGTYKGLPRVRLWQVWNEPNLSFYLVPQYVDEQPASPAIYRQMVNAAADAVHGVHADNLVIAGGQAPFAHGKPKSDPATHQVALAPMVFMRELLCMSADQPPKPTCSAQVKFDIWSHHPYTAGGPGTRAQVDGDVSLGDLPDMKVLLDAAVKAHHVVSRRPVKFWVTEFSWDSKPPDSQGVPVALEAQWISEALYDMWSTGISLVAWYLIQDGPAAQQSAQSGLYFGNGKPKSAMLTAFRFPFVGHVQQEKIDVWGRTPWGKPGSVLVEESAGKSGWTRLGVVQTDRDGIFSRTFGTPHGTYVRARLLGPSGVTSVPFPLAGPKNLNVNPFGAPNG